MAHGMPSREPMLLSVVALLLDLQGDHELHRDVVEDDSDARL
jgi:hypothetical protein